jgi:hypothetical protein
LWALRFFSGRRKTKEGEHVKDRKISASKLLEWIEESPKADGFWLGSCAVEAFDNLTDAINNGQFDDGGDEI